MVRVVMILALFLSGCSLLVEETPFREERYGLPSVEIDMRDEDFSSITKEAHVNEWIGIKLTKSSETNEASLRRHGDVSRGNPKPSYKVRTRSGDIVYSSQLGEKSFSKYYLANYLFEKSGIATGETYPVFLTVNNKEEGLYLVRESIDETFFDKRDLSAGSLYKFRGGATFSFQTGRTIYDSFSKELPHGSIIYDDIIELVRTVDQVRISHDWEQLEKRLDIENALRYYAVSTLTGHWDGIRKNCFIWREDGTGLFRFIPWDLDRTFEAFELRDGVLPSYENGLFELLMENPDYRERVQEIQREVWDYQELLQVLGNHTSDINDAYNADPYIQKLGDNIDDGICDIKEYILRVDQMISGM